MNEFEVLRPEHAVWWRLHEADPPTVMVRCGRDGCRKLLGELKTDGEAIFILWRHRFGEATADSPPVEPPITFEPLRRQLHERDSQPLRDIDDGRRVTRRYRGLVVQPLEALSYAVCPEHGIVPIDYPDARSAELRRFVQDTQRGSKRTYLLFRENPLRSDD